MEWLIFYIVAMGKEFLIALASVKDGQIQSKKLIKLPSVKKVVWTCGKWYLILCVTAILFLNPPLLIFALIMRWAFGGVKNKNKTAMPKSDNPEKQPKKISAFRRRLTHSPLPPYFRLI